MPKSPSSRSSDLLVFHHKTGQVVVDEASGHIEVLSAAEVFRSTMTGAPPYFAWSDSFGLLAEGNNPAYARGALHQVIIEKVKPYWREGRLTQILSQERRWNSMYKDALQTKMMATGFRKKFGSIVNFIL